MGEHVFDSGEDREPGNGPELMEAIQAATSGLDHAQLDRLERIADLDSSQGFHYDGYTSVSAFLSHRCGMGVREANRTVFLARALGEMAYSVKLVRSGDLTLSQFEVLAHAWSNHPEAFATDEAALAESVVGLSWTDTRRAVTYWRCLYDEPEELSDPDPSRLHSSKTFGGRGRLDGDLAPEDHNLLETALEPLISELVNSTPEDQLPSRSILRAMALTELIRRHLASDQSPSDHGNRPQVAVIVPWDTLRGADDQPAELGDGTLISAADARRLACDAQVCRLLTGPNSEILDLGRSRRSVSPAQWRALVIRDRHCRFPGCRRPASWCDAHHTLSWTELGHTDLGDLCLLCRHHHTLIHRQGWTITNQGNGTFVFTRPDATTLANGPP